MTPTGIDVPLEPRDIQLRAFTERKRPSGKDKAPRKRPTPSSRILIFDTETKTDETQNLRFGAYQLREDGDCEPGLFYSEDGLTHDEIVTLKAYAARQHLECRTLREFLEEVFFQECVLFHGSIVGFNLPFDLSRLANHHESSKSYKYYRLFQHGFSLKLFDDDETRPRIKVKHLSSRAAFIEFAQPGEGYKGKAKKNKPPPKIPSFFVDVRTLAGVLLSESHSLESLSASLEVETPKRTSDDHGKLLDDEYIEYALRDVQATWECYQKLTSKLAEHNLPETAAHDLVSEASLGKAYLGAMGIQPWRKVQHDFDPVRIGQIMSTYYGGRSEVHIRRKVTPAYYCDFLSMYPTVNTLMGLWEFIISDGIEEEDATDDIRQKLESWTPEHLQQQANWKHLHAIVQVLPDDDVLPVRSVYSYAMPRHETGKSANIAINRLTSKVPLWFTLADCLASKFLHPNQKAPNVVQAIRFRPKSAQTSLTPVCLEGKTDRIVDPRAEDFFKRVIELRNDVKALRDCAKTEAEYEQLDAEQFALKILANSTSYGIFVETLVEDLGKPEDLKRYGFDGKETVIKSKFEEKPGKYFHPLVATLITGAARLMLALSEWKAKTENLDWVFCDTDGIAFALTGELDDSLADTAKRVQDWFQPLNPYALQDGAILPESILQSEKENFAREKNESGKKSLLPLFAYAVSAKRYALFNITDAGKVDLRKASAHGLGHLLPPYEATDDWKKKSKADFWQEDVWTKICQSENENPGETIHFMDDERLQVPAASRYSATTPALIRWFKDQNEGAAYSEQIRPFNFLLCFQARDMKVLGGSDDRANEWRQKHKRPPRPVAPFDKNPSIAANNAHDRITGEPIPESWLKSYAQSIAQYHLSDEAKFLGGQKDQSGTLQRRHVEAFAVRHIGKEAHNWEEDFFTGADRDTALRYEDGIFDPERVSLKIASGCRKFGTRELNRVSGVGDKVIEKIINGQIHSFRTQAIRLFQSVYLLEIEISQTSIREARYLDELRARSDEIGIPELATQLGVDASNLSKMLKGQKPLAKKLRDRLA